MYYRVTSTPSINVYHHFAIRSNLYYYKNNNNVCHILSLVVTGFNHYGDDLVQVLKSVKDPVDRSQYILMDKINTPVYKNYIAHIDFESPRLLDVVNEIGIFGVLIR